MTALISLHPSYTTAIPKEELPVTIDSTSSRGKNMFIHFTNGHSLHLHFGMTGYLLVSQEGNKDKKYLKRRANVKYRFQFADGSEHFWGNHRRFACEKVEYGSTAELTNIPGYDVLLDEPTKDELWAVRPPRGRNVYTFILEQGPFLGIGNYLAAMTLYRTKISPHRNTKDLTKEEFYSLFMTAKRIVQEVIAMGGHTIHSFALADDRVLGEFDVTPYKREFDHDGEKVVVEQIGSRSCYWVPTVQK